MILNCEQKLLWQGSSKGEAQKMIEGHRGPDFMAHSLHILHTYTFIGYTITKRETYKKKF
jgi:hypothetical protein